MKTIQELSSKYHWLRYNESEQCFELFLDHHSLSTFRTCEAYFELSMMNGIYPKGRAWSLDFGIFWHKMIEEFYKQKKAGTYTHESWLPLAFYYWDRYNMDYHKDKHKMYKTLGGLEGAVAMLAQYTNYFAQEIDSLRPLAIEVTFGKAREVFLGEFSIISTEEKRNLSYDCMLEVSKDNLKLQIVYKTVKVKCYLTGRIDFLMDSGSAIGPLDHKTTSYFKGDVGNAFDPQEGMTGYVFAVNQIVRTMFPELAATRKTDRVWMNMAQITPVADPMARFKRIPIYKTQWQLAEYAKRQVETFKKIFAIASGAAIPDWNGNACAFMYGSPCPYKNIHRQGSQEDMFRILQQDFEQRPLWDPEKCND